MLRFYSLSKRLITLSVTVWIAACGSDSASKPKKASVSTSPVPKSSSTPTNVSSGFAFFSSTVYPILKDSNRCGICHTPTGRNTPFFADPAGATIAYDAAKTEVGTFADISQSTLWDYTAGNFKDHCGVRNCNDLNFNNALTTALTAWAKAELPAVTPTPSNSPGPSATETLVGEVLIASGLVNQAGAAVTLPPSPTPTPAYAKFDLSAAGFPGAFLYFMVQRYQVANAVTNGAYLITNPSIVTPAGFTLKGLSMTLVNGTNSSVYTTWSSLNAAVPVSATAPGSSASSLYAIVPSLNLTGDKIQVRVLK